MNLFSPQEIKHLLSQYEAKPSKGFGQNFLINKGVLDKIIEEANIKKDDIILEIGPGLGTLTIELVKKAKKVICVEKDKKMLSILKENVKEYKNVEIISDDILKTDIKKLVGNKKYRVVANIPYYITAPLIRFLLENKCPPTEIIFMVQKEVAQRICANPPKMSLLAVSVQYYAQPEILFYVSKNSFWPAPKVDSAIIKITPKAIEGDPDLFFRVVRAGFSHPRKQLVNNLTTFKNLDGVKLSKQASSQWLLKNNLKESQRAETLSLKDWIHIMESC